MNLQGVSNDTAACVSHHETNTTPLNECEGPKYLVTQLFTTTYLDCSSLGLKCVGGACMP